MLEIEQKSRPGSLYKCVFVGESVWAALLHHDRHYSVSRLELANKPSVRRASRIRRQSAGFYRDSAPQPQLFLRRARDDGHLKTS